MYLVVSLTLFVAALVSTPTIPFTPINGLVGNLHQIARSDAALLWGGPYKASFTMYGFSAAASQNLYGVGPGAGADPACGTCWQPVGETDSNGNPLSNAGTSIIVMVTNLCPAQGNPLCAQNGLTGTNQYGANVNFDLCIQSGAPAAFFGNDGTGLAVGTATQMSCSKYSGTVVY